MSDDGRAAAARLLWRLPADGAALAPYLYCLLDAARDERIHPRLRGFAARLEIASLYNGPAARELAGVAPYLVNMGSDRRVFDWIWDEGWGRAWGVFFWSVHSFGGIRDHFRTLTKARLPDGRAVLFRFYDPRVLATLLPSCDKAQLREMFGPVNSFSMEAAGGAAMATFSCPGGELARSRHPVRAAA